MTTTEIIKAMKDCGCTPNCDWCPYYDPEKQHSKKCYERRNEDFDNFLNRQQAEIERLKGCEKNCDDCAGCTNYIYDCSLIESEAYKEFAERLKGFANGNYIFITKQLLDNLLKEMG